MKPSEVSRALAAIIPTGQSVLILGPPGVGKSSVAFQAASAVFGGESGEDLSIRTTVKGLPDAPWMSVIRALDRDPVDLRGLPYVKEGRTCWSAPDVLTGLRAEGGGVILIEELPQALPAVQCVLRELLLDHRIGGHRIPDGWTVVATGNRQEDRAGSAKLLTHVASSVVLLTLDVSNDDWQDWAIRSNLHPSVRAFLNFKPGALHDFEASRLNNTDPRSWERVAALVDAVPEELLLSVVAGCCTPGHAAEFVGFRQLYTQLPDPRELLAKPDTKLPTEMSVLYALSGALVDAVRGKKGNDKELPALIKLVGKMPKPIAVLTMRDACHSSVCPALIRHPASAGWLKEHKELLLGK